MPVDAGTRAPRRVQLSSRVDARRFLSRSRDPAAVSAGFSAARGGGVRRPPPQLRRAQRPARQGRVGGEGRCRSLVVQPWRARAV